tara:strand:+ start:6108 stop:6926 length:819 start_codon:yes stop_codon:yes gene_type:complete
MNYQTFEPHPDLAALVKCHWTLEVSASPDTQKQRIIFDGCMEMFFILGVDVMRFTSEDQFIIQPRAMVVGQITKPFFIQPVGYVNTFAIRFYPYGFANFIKVPIIELADNETPLDALFGKHASQLENQIIHANSTKERIEIVEQFLLNKLADQVTIDSIVKSTIDTLLKTSGSASITSILSEKPSKKRSLERKFSKQVGMSPKQLGKVIRLQAALKTMINKEADNLTQVAYESEYYDQAHFIKDFKAFTGINPKDYLSNDQMMLSSLIYSND